MPIPPTPCRPDGRAAERAGTVPADRLRVLVNEHTRPLLGYAARRCARPEDAADVVAEVFTVAWRRIDAVPSDDEARPWLFGVARNVMANRRRSERRHGRLVERMRQELAAMPPAEPATDIALAVGAAMERLPADDRELLRLTCWEGLSPTEIATAMDVPPGTVRSRLHRARAHLRELLEDRSEVDERSERSPSSGHVEGAERPLGTECEDQP